LVLAVLVVLVLHQWATVLTVLLEETQLLQALISFCLLLVEAMEDSELTVGRKVVAVEEAAALGLLAQMEGQKAPLAMAAILLSKIRLKVVP
jgi:hypothetical protein